MAPVTAAKKFSGSSRAALVEANSDAAALEQRQRGGHQPAVILFRLERAALLRLREGGRIEDDQVEHPAFFREPPQPIERVAVNEIVRRRVKSVQLEIAPAPSEIFFGKVQAGDARARPSPRKRKNRTCRRRCSAPPRRPRRREKAENPPRRGSPAGGGGCPAGRETSRSNNPPRNSTQIARHSRAR